MAKRTTRFQTTLKSQKGTGVKRSQWSWSNRRQESKKRDRCSPRRRGPGLVWRRQHTTRLSATP